jgi:purine-nucleoside phosphorylase
VNAKLAVIAGSGMAGLGDAIDTRAVTRFEDIDGVGACGVSGHAGDVREGTIAGRECVLVVGRRHGYENELPAMTRLVAWLAARGVTHLLAASAAGALNGSLRTGELVLVREWVDRQARGPGARALRPDAALARRVEHAALRAGIALHRGTGVCGMGPAYETRAEVAALQVARGDVATMSGAPEIAAATLAGLPAASLVVVTNPCTGIAAAVPSHPDVLRVGREASRRVAALVSQLIANN